MPTKPKKPCRHPGCPELTSDIFCGQHNKLHNRPSAHERGYDSKWRRLSKLYLQSHPLCVECCRNGRMTPATVIDHIIPQRGDHRLLWDQGNRYARGVTMPNPEQRTAYRSINSKI